MNRRHVTRILTVVALVAVLASGIGLLWAFDGFDGGSRQHERAIGEVIDLGPVLVRADSATAQQDYDKTWRVKVQAECQLTDESGPSLTTIGDDLFLIVLTEPPRTRADRRVLGFGGGSYGLKRDYLSPGLPPLPCTFSGVLPAEADPSSGVTLVLAGLVFGDSSVMGNQDERWYPGQDLYVVTLPVTVLDKDKI